MPIRILHVVDAFGVGGGVENGIANLIERMDQNRFEHVLCGIFHVGTQIERYPLDRVRLICLEQKPRRFSTQAAALSRLMREVKPDVVHSRNWGALETVAAGRWVGSCAVVHSEHGVEVNPEKEPRRRFLVKRIAYEMAHRVFSVSYDLRKTLVRRTGCSPRRIDVIHNGVNATRFHREPAAGVRYRRELGISETEFCIGCVGRLNPVKDYPTLLRAARLLASHCPDFRVLIAGDGPERSALHSLVNASPELRGRVLLLGPITPVAEFLNALDVYAIPSICEGISNALLEAMATGLPVVISAVSGNLEVAVDGESGLAFPVGDAEALASTLMRLRQEPDTRYRLGDGALRRVKAEFSLESMVRKYEEMYESAAARYSVAPATRNPICHPAG